MDNKNIIIIDISSYKSISYVTPPTSRKKLLTIFSDTRRIYKQPDGKTTLVKWPRFVSTFDRYINNWRKTWWILSPSMAQMAEETSDSCYDTNYGCVPHCEYLINRYHKFPMVYVVAITTIFNYSNRLSCVNIIPVIMAEVSFRVYNWTD